MLVSRSFLFTFNLAFTLVTLHPANAATGSEDEWACPQNAMGMAESVRDLLSGQFHAGADATELNGSFRALEALSLRSGHCSAAARSTSRTTPGRGSNIEEWHAINQWLSRLVNIMALNVSGDLRRPWQDEYALFAEIYEFEP